MTYRTAFPDYPVEAMPSIPDGWTDRSWKNEPCPCFIHEMSGLVLWVDYPENRELDDCPRFVVQRCTSREDGAWQFGDHVDLFETDCWDTVVRSLPNFM